MQRRSAISSSCALLEERPCALARRGDSSLAEIEGRGPYQRLFQESSSLPGFVAVQAHTGSVPNWKSPREGAFCRHARMVSKRECDAKRTQLPPLHRTPAARPPEWGREAVRNRCSLPNSFALSGLALPVLSHRTASLQAVYQVGASVAPQAAVNVFPARGCTVSK